MSYIKQQVLHERKLRDRQVLITEDGNVEITPNGGEVTIKGNLNVSGAAPGPTNQLIYYVSLEGSDANSGLHSGPSAAKRTIKAAIEAAPAGATIQVAPGDYYEENPMTLKERQTVRGDSLRNTRIYPNNNTQTIFYVDNACYLFQLTFRGLRDPGWCVEIKPNALVTTSPYVQNCSNLNGPWLNDGTEFIPFQTEQIVDVTPTNRPIINDEAVPLAKRVNDTGGGNGMKVDGAQYHPDSLVSSMVADAFTQIAQGGIGFEITNFGYTQIVSCFSVFTRIGFLTTNGGYLSISNSVSDFGTFGLIADGKDPTKYTSAYPTQNFYSTVASVSMVATGAGYTPSDPPTVTFDTPSGIGGTVATGTAIVDQNSGEITGVTILDGGSGYEVVPNVSISGGTFTSQASADVNLNKNFSVEIEGTNSVPQVGSVIEFAGDPLEYYITDVNTTIDPFNYNEVKCRRDNGLIFDAILGDAVLSTDYQSIVAGRTYTQQVAQTVTGYQLDQTLYGIEQLKLAMLEQVPSADATNANIRNIIIARAQQVKDIIETGTVPLHTLADLATVDADDIAFKDTLIANRDFIVEEITAFIDKQFTNLEYDESKCRRDTELILEAVYRDVLLDTNHNSIVAGLSYKRAMSAYVDSNQLAATILAVRELKKNVNIQLAADATAQSRAADRLETILEIMEYNTLPSEGQYFNDPTGISNEISSTAIQLQNNKEFLKAEVIAYVNQTYPAPGFTYDQALCARDVGYIIDAVTHDALYGGNRSTLISARAYYDGAVSTVAGQETETADAIDHLRDVAAQVIQGQTVVATTGNLESQSLSGTFGTATEAGTTDTLFDIVSVAITDGLLATPSNANPDFDWINEDFFNVVKLILDNLAVLQDGVIDYISNTIQGFTYNVATCERDVDYIIDAVAYDIMYGGNKQTKRAADAYYNNAVIVGQEGFTEFSYKHLAEVIEAVTTNTLIAAPSAGSSAVHVQNTSGTATSPAVAAEGRLLVDKIAEVVQYGSSVSPIEFDHDYATLGDTALLLKRDILLPLKETILDTAIDELNYEYGGTHTVQVFPGVLSVLTSQKGTLSNVSTVSTSGHAFEYVGAGITYNALPFFGGNAIEGNEFVELNGGKVFAGGVVDQVGNFRVGNFFRVNALTGAVTINADQIDLQGLSSIGPFRRLGVPVGVEIREASNNSNLISSLGSADVNTVPTQVAVRDYISARYLGLGGGTLTGDLAINGGDLTSSAATFNLINDTTTTINIGGAATEINIGSATGTTTVNTDLSVQGELFVSTLDGSTAGKIATDATSFFLLDDNVVALSIGGDATTVDLGGLGSTVNVHNITGTGDIDFAGQLNIDSGIITTTSTTAEVMNNNVTTVTMFTGASNITIGDTGGQTNLRNDVDIAGNLTVHGYDASPAAFIDAPVPTVNLVNTPRNIDFGHAGTDIVIGATTGQTNIRHNLIVDNNIAAQGGEITTTNTVAKIFEENVTDIDMLGQATTINMGNIAGTLTIKSLETIFDSVSHIQIPKGITNDRPTGISGQIRFNTETQNFEGYDGLAWGSLGGVKDVDQDTFISAEDTPGTDNDELKFTTGGTQRLLISNTQFDLDASVIATFANTTTSTSKDTGAVVIEGGVGIEENLHVGGYISGDNNLLTITTQSADKIVIGANTIETLEQFKIVSNDSLAGNVVYPITVAHHTTSGLIASGSGVGLAFEHESSNDNFETVGLIDLVSTDITGTVEDYDMVFKAMFNGAPANDRLRLSGTTATISLDTIISGSLTVDGNLNAHAFQGSVFSEDSSVMVDAINNQLFASEIQVDSLFVTNPLGVTSGGTGVGTFTIDGILYGNGTDTLQVTDAAGDADVSSSFQLLTVTSDADSTPVWTDTIDGGSFGGASGGGGVTSDPDGTLVVGTTIRFDNLSIITVGEELVATVSETEVDSFDITTYRSAKCTVQVKDTTTGEFQISEIIVIHDGTTAYLTTYGTIHTGAAPLATFDSDILNNNCRILATGASANSMTYKIQRTTMTV